MRMRDDLHRWAAGGIDFVQLREKELEAGEVFALAQHAMRALQAMGPSRPRLLVNGRPDLAAAARADGVHLTSRPGEFLPAQVREVFGRANLPACFVSVSCHTPGEVVKAREHGADLILFGPVFEKRIAGIPVSDGRGLPLLSEACSLAGSTPVLALGGVTATNTPACLRIGAAGVAGIRLFAGERSPA